jgi:hypothetical protein
MLTLLEEEDFLGRLMKLGDLPSLYTGWWTEIDHSEAALSWMF